MSYDEQMITRCLIIRILNRKWKRSVREEAMLMEMVVKAGL